MNLTDRKIQVAPAARRSSFADQGDLARLLARRRRADPTACNGASCRRRAGSLAGWRDRTQPRVLETPGRPRRGRCCAAAASAGAVPNRFSHDPRHLERRRTLSRHQGRVAANHGEAAWSLDRDQLSGDSRRPPLQLLHLGGTGGRCCGTRAQSHAGRTRSILLSRRQRPSRHRHPARPDRRQYLL